MKPEKFKAFLEKQKKAIEEAKWQEGIIRNADPGQEFVHQWIKKWAKKFRKDYALSDLKEALLELKNVRKQMEQYLQMANDLLKIVNNCEEKILDSIELIETEENIKNGGGID